MFTKVVFTQTFDYWGDITQQLTYKNGTGFEGEKNEYGE